jgi:hypothetical protein
MMQGLLYFLVLPGAVVLPIAAALLMQKGLQQRGRWRWLLCSSSALPLVLLLEAVFWLAQGGAALTVFAVIVSILGIVVAIVQATLLAMHVPTRFKPLALGLAVAFPLLLLTTVMVGAQRTPERVSQRNAYQLVQAIHMYQSEHAAYPAELTQLVPAYLDALPAPPANSTQNWIYEGTPEQYTLRYHRQMQGIGQVCVYSSAAPDWDCQVVLPVIVPTEAAPVTGEQEIPTSE